MAEEYNEFLAEQVLNEHRPVTYRTLSRALKVHCNLAKQMLYEFHRKQNSKKPGSVHATYLLTGTKHPAASTDLSQSQNDPDTAMPSSPPLPSSSLPTADPTNSTSSPSTSSSTVRTTTILLAREADLERARAQFHTLSGIHVYSLQPAAQIDFQTLTDCNRQIAAAVAAAVSVSAPEDPAVYGTIRNTHVRRRPAGARPPVVAAAPLAPAAAPAVAATTVAPVGAAKTTEISGPKATSGAAKSAPAGLKREGSSIFKSFAKGAAAAGAKAKAKPVAAAAPTPPAAAAKDEEDDVPMTGFSSDEDDEEGAGGESGLPPELAEVRAPAVKSRKEREDELRAMMEVEDEGGDAEETEEVGRGGDGDGDEAMIDAPARNGDAVEATNEEPKEEVTVQGGRRRGRRRVMKKKTVKDEEGYLVTREEAAWESFSEDEPATKKAKTTTSTTATTPAAITGNKTVAKKVGKPGQGNIMSFFSKK